MSILEKIIAELTRHAESSAPPAGAPAAPATPPAASDAPAAPTGGFHGTDVEAVLTKLASQQREQLNWQTSIVDLLKLLNLDHGLHARQMLAMELGYKDDLSDTASMNVWLHRKVMEQLAAHGGQVPDSLKGGSQ